MLDDLWILILFYSYATAQKLKYFTSIILLWNVIHFRNRWSVNLCHWLHLMSYFNIVFLFIGSNFFKILVWLLKILDTLMSACFLLLWIYQYLEMNWYVYNILAFIQYLMLQIINTKHIMYTHNVYKNNYLSCDCNVLLYYTTDL